MSRPMNRPMMQAVASQQRHIQALARENAILRLQVGYVAKLAGVTKQVEAIRKAADINNPGQPVPDPSSEGPTETTEQAVQPETFDDVRAPGMTPGSVQNLPADTTDVALRPGETLPTSPFNDLVNVQAPIQGTETQLPLNQTRIETDVRVGDPMNPQIAFPWDISPNQSNGEGGQSKAASKGGNRTMAAIQLARLQISAGLSPETNDLFLGARIEASNVSDEEIASTITTLASVQRVASHQRQRPAGLVPRSASVRRTTPSLASDPGLSSVASISDDTSDTADADLFE
jgi:hypothetical protein